MAAKRIEKNEIATLARDMELFQGWLKVLNNPDKVLRLECGGDISVYDDIGRDPRVASVLRTRSLAVVGKEWVVEPADDSAAAERIAGYVRQVFLSFPFDLARRAILRGGVLKGFAVSEIMWEVSEGDVVIREMIPRAQRRFVFDIDSHLRLLTRQDPFQGEDMTVRYPRKFQRFVFGDEPETPYGVGLGRELYWPWWFKRNGIKFWLIFCDKFGSPTPIGKYPRGSSKQDQDTLLAACGAIQTDAGIIIPEGMSLDLLEAARSGSIDTYESLCAFMNDESTVSVLGQLATTQGTPGKLGGDDSQENVREDLVKADADALCEALNAQVIRWLVDYNFGPQKRYPKMWIRVEAEQDLKALAERDEILARCVDIPARYFYETYGVPEPQKGDTVASPATAPQGGGEPATEFAESGFTPEQQAIEDLADQAGELAAAALADNEALILEALQAADSYDDALARLLELYPRLRAADLQDLLERALLNADLFGRYSAGKEGR